MKNKLFFPLLLFLPLCSCHLSYGLQAKALLEDENHVVEIGDVIEVSPRTLIKDGVEKVTQGQIIFPDGSSKSGKSFTITIPGVYIVNYRAIFGTEEVNESIYYNCYRKSGDLFITSNENNKPQTGEYSFNTKTSHIQGAKIKLDSNTVFTYDGVIDFNTFDPNEPFVEFMVDTSKQGDSDLQSFVIRLTDVDDATNYIELSITDSGEKDDDGKGCYILAGSNNQFKTGYEFGKLHTTNYGTNVGSSFRALPSDNPAKSARIFLNYAQKALYVNPIIYTNETDIISDLDDKEIYGSMIWEGFTNGKATLSIFAKSLYSSSANIIISKAAGMDLSQMVFEDHTAPVISVDYGNQSPSNIPQASVNKAYKIFDAVITDNFDKDLSYTTSVTYQDLENGKTKDISIINNTFTPKQPGNYKITYTAKDYSNNIATKVIDVVAVNDSQQMNVSLDVNSISQLLYSKINLPSINDVHISGGSGLAKVERILEDSNHEEIILLDDVFVPTKVGTYRAYYKATDYIGNISTCLLTIEVTKPDKPIFVGDLVLPRVLIKGHSYSLPEYQSVEVVNNQTIYLDSEVYVNNTKLTNGTFVADDNCNITYKVSGQTGNSEYNTTIDVINSGSPINQSNYFYSDDFEKVENINDVTLSANSDASALFASVLPYDNPFVKFSINESTAHFGELQFKYSDHLNPSISLTFHLTFKNGKNYISIGNSDEKFEFGMEENENNKLYAIDFNNASKVLSDINHKEITKIKYDDNGQPFIGFAHGLYLDISMKDVSEKSDIRMLSIANQVMGHLDMHDDFGSPIIIFNNKFVNEQSYGSDAYVPSVEVFDVLNDVSVTVSVRGPDGNMKLNNQDATVTNMFKLDSFGSYLVTYRATDKAGNYVSYPRKITVYDFVAPELMVNYNLKETYSLNASITIPSYSVKDNLNDYTVDIFLILPSEEERLLIIDRNGQVTSFLDSSTSIYNSSFKVNANTFKAEQYGRYTLRYVAYDSDFNKVVKEYHFTVK